MDYKDVEQGLIDFRDKKGWEKYHNLKDLAISLNLEASEVLEIFQWEPSNHELTAGERDHLEEELADTLIYTFYMCNRLGINPLDIVAKKMKFNQKRHWDKTE
ncbi:nucleotide pyrophosphohydrolase [Lactiplantibacillus nangangensis]|uniref:Nucleotide pyrophosphohydrolase n=1 Tax=Lactiplantibacillus nangangensis TaxID=2559917 RepID=A0ABW1SMA6_9LACO|nr:nucleotide pyrophosphohydrolase [Lactiplantibacillus nangangensis]